MKGSISFYKGPTQFTVDSDDREELLKLISMYYVAVSRT